MKNAFKKCTIALSGDFGGPSRSHENCKKWVEKHGGRITSRIDADTTHLVCTIDHYKRQVAIVKLALKEKGCKIVNFDWLEDSLLKSSPKRVGEYLMKGLVKTNSKAKAKKKEVRAKNIKKGVKAFEKGCDDFKSAMHADGFHIYRDSTGFAYDITLARSDLTTNTNERYAIKVSSPTSTSTPTPTCSTHRLHVLTPLYPCCPPPARRRVRVPLPAPRLQCVQLYESHISPATFACFTNYSSPIAGTARLVLAPLGSSFQLAMEQFEHFFRVKTRLEWSERNARVERGGDRVGCFVYSMPAEGEPVGLIDPESLGEEVEW